MRSVYDFTGSSYKQYIEAKRGDDVLDSKTATIYLKGYYGNRIENALTFMPYFVTVEAKKEGNPKMTDTLVAERLAKAKANYKPAKQPEFVYPYENMGLSFKPFRLHDENFNHYDCRSYIAIIGHCVTDAEKDELEKALTVHFCDPYCDGRDCTGAPFTAWIKFLRCKDRTIVIHKVNYDY